MPKFKIGDVVDWHWPIDPDMIKDWRARIGQGPFVVTATNDEHGVFMEQISDGKSANTNHYGGSGIHQQVLRKDEFLTAVYRASGKINTQPKPKSERKS